MLGPHVLVLCVCVRVCVCTLRMLGNLMLMQWIAVRCLGHMSLFCVCFVISFSALFLCFVSVILFLVS